MQNATQRHIASSVWFASAHHPHHILVARRVTRQVKEKALELIVVERRPIQSYLDTTTRTRGRGDSQIQVGNGQGIHFEIRGKVSSDLA